MKITDIKTFLIDSERILSEKKREDSRASKFWLFILIETDEGISGFGEASNYPFNGSKLIAEGVSLAKELLIGENPMEIDRLWHAIYRKFTYLGSRGLPTAIISGIDIALWDIKGKVAGLPIYELLGGKFRENVDLYANGWFYGCKTRNDFAQAAVHAVEKGFKALKFDPFSFALKKFQLAFVSGELSLSDERRGLDLISSVREAIGDDIEILIEGHGNFNVPTAIRIANKLSVFNVTWFEEPIPPESISALRQVRNNTDIPISVGERLFTRFDFLLILESGLADFLMPDVVWTGGISELRKISTLAETYYIPMSPHNAMGPLQVFAGAQVMLATPNFYKLEFGPGATDKFNALLNEPILHKDGQLLLPDKPGLGTELNVDFLMKKSTIIG